MRPFVVIRKCLRNDDLNVQNVIRDYIQSQFKSAFFFILFREVSFLGLQCKVQINLEILNFLLDHVAINCLVVGNFVHFCWSSAVYVKFIEISPNLMIF